MKHRQTNRMKASPLSLMFALLLPLLLTACGGDDGTALDGGTVARAQLSWTPPTQNTDNTPLTDLQGYRLYIGDSPSNLQPAGDIPATDSNGNPVTQYTVTSDDIFSANNQLGDLSGKTVYFALTAYNSLRIESSLSQVVSKTF